jgi:hypothetical protein
MADEYNINAIPNHIATAATNAIDFDVAWQKQGRTTTRQRNATAMWRHFSENCLVDGKTPTDKECVKKVLRDHNIDIDVKDMAVKLYCMKELFHLGLLKKRK